MRDLKAIVMESGLELPESHHSNWMAFFDGIEEMMDDYDRNEKIILFFSLANSHRIYPTTHDLLSLSNDKNTFSSFFKIIELTVLSDIRFRDEMTEIPRFILSVIQQLDENILTAFFSKTVGKESDYNENVTNLYALFDFCVCNMKYLSAFDFRCVYVTQHFDLVAYFLFFMKTLAYVMKTCHEQEIINAFFGKFESLVTEEEISSEKNLKKLVDCIWCVLKEIRKYGGKINNSDVEEFQSVSIIFLCTMRDRFRDKFSDVLYKWLSVKIKKIGTFSSFSHGALSVLAATVQLDEDIFLPAMLKPRIVSGELKSAIPYDIWLVIFSFRYGLSYEALNILACSARRAYRYPRLFFAEPKQLPDIPDKIDEAPKLL